MIIGSVTQKSTLANGEPLTHTPFIDWLEPTHRLVWLYTNAKIPMVS